jgi:predicted neuraminidase
VVPMFLKVIFNSELVFMTIIKKLVLLWISCLAASAVFGQVNPWRQGIVTDEFIFEKAPYPECHAATIAETKKGLVAAWFGGTKERNPDVCIWLSRQRRNGKWTSPENVANGIQKDTSRYPCWNPVLYQVPGGKLILFYKVGPKPAEWKGFYKTSTDEGVTWSAQQELPHDILGPIKNKPVTLHDGAILSPSSTESSGSKVHFELSADGGQTWKLIGPVDNGQTGGAIQPSILFYPGGRLQALCRSKDRAILETWSADNGQTWSPLAKTALPNNNSGTDAVTLKDGRQLLVYNHVLPPGKETKGARTPLNVALSKDGKVWFASLVLEDSPISQYSYPGVIQTSDGMVHVVYTWRRQRIKHVVIDPAKLKMVEITNGQWPVVNGYTLPVIKGSTTDL